MARDEYTPFREFIDEMDKAIAKTHSQSGSLSILRIVRGAAQGVVDRHEEEAAKMEEILRDGPGLIAEDNEERT